MTTFWARMLIFNEYKHGDLPKKAAQHFDALLDRCEYITLNSNNVKLTNLNGYDTRCVLGNIGASKCKDTNIYKFDVIKYIKETVVDTNNEGNTKRDILANIIGQEFIGLDYEIESGLREDLFSEEDLRLIKRYLEDTYTITAEMDVSRSSRDLIKKISKILKEEYKELHHINDSIMGR